MSFALKAVSCVGLTAHAVVPLIVGSDRAQRAIEKKTAEQMNMKSVVKMPLISSAILFGLYIVFKFFHIDILQLILTIYFVYIGAESIAETFDFFFSRFASPEKHTFTIPFTSFKVEYSKAELLGMAAGAVVSVAWALTRNWVLNNVLATCFTIAILGLLTLPSFNISALLLLGLFVYDIFWVFSGDVMVTVAKKIDGPIKFVFPRDGHFFSNDLALLGLGDIAIPGLYIALMKRVDAHFHGEYNPRFFLVNMIAYFVALAVTFAFFFIFNHGQVCFLPTSFRHLSCRELTPSPHCCTSSRPFF